MKLISYYFEPVVGGIKLFVRQSDKSILFLGVFKTEEMAEIFLKSFVGDTNEK